MSERVPEGWESTEISDVRDVADRYSFTGGPFGSNLKSEDYTEKGVRIIQLQNIGDGQFLNKYKIFTSEEKADELKSCNIFPGDIILSKMGDPVARATLIPDFDTRYLMASDGIRLSVNENKYDTKFILESINHFTFRNQAELSSTGSTRKRIGLVELRTLTISLPPLPEQKKIASILTSVDEVIETTQKQIDKLLDLKKATMNELLTKGIGHTEFKDSELGRIPKNWEVKPLGDIADLKVGYAFKSIWFSDVGCRLLRGENVGYGTPIWKETRYLDQDKVATYSDYNLSLGDIIIGMDRTFAKSGSKISRILESDLPCLLVQRVGKFVPSGLNPEFMWHLLRSDDYLSQLLSQEKGMDIPHLSKQEILEPLTPVIPLPEQQKIGQILSSIDAKIESVDQKLSQTQSLKKSLMQDLLTGKVRVQVN